MDDIRLPSAEFTLEGKTYTLVCNNNVLADVQEAYGGVFRGALEGSAIKTVLTVAAAMLNDCADERGWPERFTARVLGRQLPPDEINHLGELVMPLFTDSLLRLRDSTPAPQPPAEDGEKNA